MNWEVIAALGSCAFAALTAFNAWLTMTIKAQITESRLFHAEQRLLDRESNRNWIEAEFMRKSELETRFAALSGRIEKLENRRRAPDRVVADQIA